MAQPGFSYGHNGSENTVFYSSPNFTYRPHDSLEDTNWSSQAEENIGLDLAVNQVALVGAY